MSRQHDNPATLADVSPKARLALLFTLFALLPATAIWSQKYFVTQDGPAHLYNANILLEGFRQSDSYASTFAVRQWLTPNVAGHWMLGVGLESCCASPARRGSVRASIAWPGTRGFPS